jgi:hypothetical protein
MMGVLARTLERGKHIIRTEPLLAGKSDLIPLSPRSMGHRGRQLESIFVDSDLWPLSEDLVGEFAPCLHWNGGRFYVAHSSAVEKQREVTSRGEDA